jgi:hypothetical protein
MAQFRMLAIQIGSKPHLSFPGWKSVSDRSSKFTKPLNFRYPSSSNVVNEKEVFGNWDPLKARTCRKHVPEFKAPRVGDVSLKGAMLVGEAYEIRQDAPLIDRAESPRIKLPGSSQFTRLIES